MGSIDWTENTMATVVSRASQTSSGIGFVVRNPTAGDAEAWIDHAVAVMQESDFTKTEPEDLVSSLQEQEAWIAAMNAHVGNLALVAEIEGDLVGVLYCRAPTSRRMAHVCAFAMSVRRQWWGQGVGTSLVQCLVDWARAHPEIRKVTMRALVSNARALALYRKFGFFVEGRFAEAIKAGDGTFVDDFEMGLFVKPK